MTTPSTLGPLLLTPVLHARVWGGHRLRTLLGKTPPNPAVPYGESWELHDTAVVAAGRYAGYTLGALLAEQRDALVGPEADPDAGLPLLVKFLDAEDWLSVQVHPDDAQAAALEDDPRGKTEAWVVLEATPGAELVVGVQPGTAPDVLADAIRHGTLEPLLVKAGVRAGDVLLLHANTIHALGPGLLIYEVQQSSDVTYRLYDWGRAGLDGQPRTLHIEQGLAVANLHSLPTLQHPEAQQVSAQPSVLPLVASAYFVTVQHTLRPDTPHLLDTGGTRFAALTCVRGAATVRAPGHTDVAFTHGQTVLVPACVGAYTLVGDGRVLLSAQP